METLKKSKVRGKADKRSEIIAQYPKLEISNGFLNNRTKPRLFY